MDYQLLGLENYEELVSFFKEAYLPGPYQISLKESEKLVSFALFHDSKFVYGLKENQKLIGVVTFIKKSSTLHLETLLLSRNHMPSLKDIKEQVITIAQLLFVKRLSFLTDTFLFPEIKEKTLQLSSLKTALVLGGGGAKGAYEIGAYEALQEAGVTFEIITGTSVGALNGGLILQEDLENGKKLWRNIVSSQVLDFSYNDDDLLAYRADFLKAAVKNLGISTLPLKKLVDSYVSAEKIQESNIEFYVVTTTFPQLEEKVVNLKTVPLEEVTSWLIASSSFFPGMEMTEIENQKYVDGGYKNNLPIDVALLNGAEKVVAIDVKGPGVLKSIKTNVPTLLLKTPWNLGDVLYFDGDLAKVNIELGRIETQKSLGLGMGYWYTFYNGMKKQQYLFAQSFLKEKNWQVTNKCYQELSEVYGKKVTIYNLGLSLLEILGLYFDLFPASFYSYSTFTKEIKKSYLKKEKNVEEQSGILNRGLVSPKILYKKQQFTRLLDGKETYLFNDETLQLLKEVLDFILKTTNLKEE